MKHLDKFLMTAAAALLGTAPLYANDIVPATFEDLGLAPESHWCGDTDDEDYMMGTFRSGSFEFNNFYWADYDSWAFFGYASYTDNSYTGDLSQQWNNVVGGGYESETYGVLYYSSWMGVTTATLPDFPEGAAVEGMWVVNSAWVADAIVNGDGMSGPFGEGDSLRLIVHGHDAEGNVKDTEFMLADYTSANPEEWYAVNEWRWMDLSVLGPVVKLTFDIESTKANSYGMTTPGYVCFDNLGGGATTGVESIAGDLSADDFRVAARDGHAVVTGRAAEFEVRAIAADGRMTDMARTTDGRAELSLSAGLNLLVISTAEGTVTVKVMD